MSQAPLDIDHLCRMPYGRQYHTASTVSSQMLRSSSDRLVALGYELMLAMPLWSLRHDDVELLTAGVLRVYRDACCFAPANELLLTHAPARCPPPPPPPPPHPPPPPTPPHPPPPHPPITPLVRRVFRTLARMARMPDEVGGKRTVGRQFRRAHAETSPLLIAQTLILTHPSRTHPPHRAGATTWRWCSSRWRCWSTTAGGSCTRPTSSRYGASTRSRTPSSHSWWPAAARRTARPSTRLACGRRL